MMFKALPVALLAAVAAAQDFGNVPSCANSCIDAAFSESGCSSKDNLACLCMYVIYPLSILLPSLLSLLLFRYADKDLPSIAPLLTCSPSPTASSPAVPRLSSK